MNATTQTRGKPMRRAIRVAKVITPARLFGGLAMGAMLIAATALAYQEVNQGEADSLSSSNQVTPAVPAQLDSEAPESSASRPFSNREIERLEARIDLLLADAARDPSKNTSSLNREIERLDERIDMSRAAAHQPPASSQTSSGATAASTGRALMDQLAEANEKAYDELSESFIGIPYSRAQTGTWPPDTEYYQDPDYRERQTAY
jgi:hypothetical protein